jgi:flagellar assembly protein FliH
MSARHIVVRVHPDDHALVADGASEALMARGARLLADATVQRGGCTIDSDVGAIDASIETRWSQAAAALGGDAAWDDAFADAVADPAAGRESAE